jgi:hypothetical protein
VTNREINETIALCAGWSHVVNGGIIMWRSPGGVIKAKPPNFAGNMNIMQDLLRSLPDMRLRVIAKFGYHANLYLHHHMMIATPRQLAECYLRYMGKWQPATSHIQLPLL